MFFFVFDSKKDNKESTCNHIASKPAYDAKPNITQTISNSNDKNNGENDTLLNKNDTDIITHNYEHQNDKTKCHEQDNNTQSEGPSSSSTERNEDKQHSSNVESEQQKHESTVWNESEVEKNNESTEKHKERSKLNLHDGNNKMNEDESMEGTKYEQERTLHDKAKDNNLQILKENKGPKDKETLHDVDTVEEPMEETNEDKPRQPSEEGHIAAATSADVNSDKNTSCQKVNGNTENLHLVTFVCESKGNVKNGSLTQKGDGKNDKEEDNNGESSSCRCVNRNGNLQRILRLVIEL